MTIVPILLYHSITDDPPGWIAPYTVTPRVFSEHLRLIADSGRTVLTVSGLRAALAGHAELPARPIVLTFDDGFADFAAAATTLADAGMPSTLYVTTGALRGRSSRPSGLALPPAPMLDWSQLVGLAALGVEIGAHTHTHPQLDTIGPAAVRDELVRCKVLLEDALGQEITDFAYPHGFHTAALRDTVEAAGYRSACAVGNALSSAADHPFALARLTVRPTTSMTTLRAWLDGRGAPVAPQAELLRTKAWRTYRRWRGTRSARGVIAGID
ncbi:polysaccharide deacetylase family protein [Nocardia sp. NPDC088792]|uniref:polysaccharide deacetylase family protein n=1 Tax=Nocardia sp. NPDC088792 TaxID=3364332 RepID=UPI0038298B1E